MHLTVFVATFETLYQGLFFLLICWRLLDLPEPAARDVVSKILDVCQAHPIEHLTAALGRTSPLKALFAFVASVFNCA